MPNNKKKYAKVNRLDIFNVNNDIDVFILIDIENIGYPIYSGILSQCEKYNNIIVKGFISLSNSYKKEYIDECEGLNDSGIKLIPTSLKEAADVLLISYTNTIVTTYYLNDKIDSLKLIIYTKDHFAKNLIESVNSIYGFDNIFQANNFALINYHINNCYKN